MQGIQLGKRQAEELAQRAAVDFDAYWSFHVEQEYLRNHGTRYPEGAAPVVLKPAKYKRGKDAFKLLKGG